MIRVGIVASTLALRAGLRALLQAGFTSEEMEAIEAPGLADLDLNRAAVDILVITGDAISQAELLRLARQQEGHLGVLLLAETPLAAAGLDRLPLRSWGLLSLDSTAEELAAAVQALQQGLWVANPVLWKASMPGLLTAETEAGERPIEALTDRESEVLQLLAYGLANKQIASSLGISEHTVKFHVSSIYTKLGVTNRTEAVRRGVLQGWVML